MPDPAPHDPNTQNLLALFEQAHQTNPISIGLAVGYFYNFIDPICREVERDNFFVYEERSKDSEKRSFESEDVYLDIILPIRLDTDVFARCVTEFKHTRQGFVFLPANKRFYGINYAINDLGKRQTLTIIDLARPIMAVKQFYETVGAVYENMGKSWEDTQVSEVNAFKQTLRILQSKGYGTFSSRLDFRERG